MDERIRKLKELVEGSGNIVFFGGAGVSTESGIPDFRSVDGLYHQQYRYPPETILSHTFYEQNPEGVFPLLPQQAPVPGGKSQRGPPQTGGAGGKGKAEGGDHAEHRRLHQAAGSKTVLELHGSTLQQLLRAVRKVLSHGGGSPQRGDSPLHLRRYDQARRGAL